MRMESINNIESRTRRRAGMRLAALALLLAGCAATIHYGVRLSDWRGSVEAAHRGVHGHDREEQLRSVVVLLKSALDSVEALRVAAKSADADVRHRAASALQHISEASK